MTTYSDMANGIYLQSKLFRFCAFSICAVLLFYFIIKHNLFFLRNETVILIPEGQTGDTVIEENSKSRDHMIETENIVHYHIDNATSTLDVISAHAQSPCPSMEKEKVILLYNPKHWEILMKNSFYDFWSDCPCKCQLTQDRKRYEESDAVIFVIDLMPRVKTIPKKRNGQVWIFSQFESPHYLANEMHFEIMVKEVMDMFKRTVNWTMSYRRDSDFVFVHGDYGVRTEPLAENILDKVREEYKRKSETAAWFVSHCKTLSRREEYVSLMRSDIDVDEYGGCSRRKLPNCPKNRANAIREAWGLKSTSVSPGACFNILDEKYKFYLSFENSLCRDYLTEKSLHHVVRHDVIPIMRSGANHSLFNPPHSFIDANEFISAKDLTLYLKLLGKKTNEMLRYFEWRRFYESDYPIKNWQRSICEICQRLYEPKKYSRLYEDLYKWILKPNDEDACHFPKDLL